MWEFKRNFNIDIKNEMIFIGIKEFNFLMLSFYKSKYLYKSVYLKVKLFI